MRTAKTVTDDQSHAPRPRAGLAFQTARNLLVKFHHGASPLAYARASYTYPEAARLVIRTDLSQPPLTKHYCLAIRRGLINF